MTSARADISANKSWYGRWPVSPTCRSPMAARRRRRSPGSGRSVERLMALLQALADDVGEAPLGDVDEVVAWAEHAPAADLHLRRRHRHVGAEPIDQLFHQPARHAFALARVDVAE